MTKVEFKHENYNITSDIRLEADIAYIQGHPIVKTKTVVLYYRGSTFRASENHVAFAKELIKDVHRPQYVVELMNYLSMSINGNFLFEIYAKTPQEPESLVEATFGNRESEKVRGTTHLGRNIYKKDLLDDHNQFQLSPLLVTMNERFTRTFASIEELDYVPVYGYITASGKVDGNWKAEPILHLAIVFNVLAHQDRFAGINNQEAIASFNSIMRAKHLNETAESLNEHEYKSAIERLRLELQRERERANGLEIAKKTLEEKLDEVNARLQAAAEREEKLLDDCKRKDKKIGKLKTTVLQQLGLTEEIREQNDDLLMLSTAHRNDLQRTTNKINGLAQVVNGLSAANYDRDRDCVFIWKLYLSETAPEPSYKKEIPVNAIWLYSQIREDKNMSLPEDAEIVFEANVVNRSIYKALLEELRDECIDHHFRHILIAEENAVNFINSLQQRLEARSIHPETVDVGPIVNLIESRNTEREIAARKAARTAHVVGVRQAIIDEGKLYIKVYSRYQRIYNLDENHEMIRDLNANRFFYIKRKGKAERLTTATLEQSRFREYGID